MCNGLGCSTWQQYIAKKLFEINERGTYQDPHELRTDNPIDSEKFRKQEEELFQIARLVNCGWFASGEINCYALEQFCLFYAVVFSDYFSCILGLVRFGNNWSLDPFHVCMFIRQFIRILTSVVGNPKLGPLCFRAWSRQCLQCRGEYGYLATE